MGGDLGQTAAGVNENPQDDICYELQKLNEQIENLQTSEDERLARELQAIELTIQETERKIHHVRTTYLKNLKYLVYNSSSMVVFFIFMRLQEIIAKNIQAPPPHKVSLSW